MNKRRMYQLTRSKPFLLKSSALLIVILLVSGTAVSFLNRDRLNMYEHLVATPHYVDEQPDVFGEQPDEQVDSGVLTRALSEALSTELEFSVKLGLIADLFYYLNQIEPVPVPAPGKVDGITETQHEIATALILACADTKNGTAIQPLEKMAEKSFENANYALALALENRNDDLGAIKALHREIDLFNSEPARKRLVRIYLELEKFDAVEALARESGYEQLITPLILREIALERMDWPMIFKTHFSSAYEDINWVMVILALISGLVWAAIVIRFNGALSNVWKFIIPALLLGSLSAHATLMAVYWQECQLGFGFGETTIQQLIYCLTIGLREEGLKLLLFVPLIPFLRNKDDLIILTVAGLVGLGFALEENINYFEASAGMSATARFVTANFLHIALTAMCGLTLTRAIVHRGEDIQHAFVTFVIAVAIHGFYDAFIMVYALADYEWLTYTVFVLMGYQYFGWLRHLRDEWTDPVSATSIFTYGVILVSGVSYAIYAWNSGPLPAFQAIAMETVGIAILLFMFFREIPETVD